jgi:hypothetical protein
LGKVSGADDDQLRLGMVELQEDLQLLTVCQRKPMKTREQRDGASATLRSRNPWLGGDSR